MVGDGYCNDETNNIHCNFDGGDCCYTFVVKSFCSECRCLTDRAGEEIHHPFLWDGYCHDETNIAELNYDGGDCCLINVKRDYCSNCSCFVNGIITSPGYPQNYGNNLDFTWLIQLPLGQYIKIDFMEFDLGSECPHDFYSWFEDSLTFYDDYSVIIHQYDCKSHPNSQVVSWNNKIFIRFKTNNAITHLGFELEYQPISK